MLLWAFVGSPVVSVLLVGLEFGYLFASVLYIMTPIGNRLTVNLVVSSRIVNCSKFTISCKLD